MKRTFYLLPLLLLVAIGGVGCKKYTGEKAAAQRQEWLASLQDSISMIADQRRADSVQLDNLRNRISDEIGRFTQVSNPREVEPYYILTAFKGKYPLSSTGIAARMMKNEQAELIAALSGARFNAIRVTSGTESATSLTVPADQALNYTSGGLTTVAFTGAQADSICQLITDRRNDPVTLQYLQNGGVAKSITLSAQQKDWVADTWSVCGAHKEATRLEGAMLMASRKIEILKITLSQSAKEE